MRTHSASIEGRKYRCLGSHHPLPDQWCSVCYPNVMLPGSALEERHPRSIERSQFSYPWVFLIQGNVMNTLLSSYWSGCKSQQNVVPTGLTWHLHINYNRDHLMPVSMSCVSFRWNALLLCKASLSSHNNAQCSDCLRLRTSYSPWTPLWMLLQDHSTWITSVLEILLSLGWCLH